MKTHRPSRSPCPIGRASSIIGDRWAILILREAFLGITRFDDFLKRLRISRAALTSRLKLLADAGVILRDPPEGKRADYRLTESGKDLFTTITALRQWGDRWLFEEGHEPLPLKTIDGDEVADVIVITKSGAPFIPEERALPDWH
jgi:DNA-binding HxlR family transcriptional regulator